MGETIRMPMSAPGRGSSVRSMTYPALISIFTARPGVLAGAMPARPKTNELDLSLTMSLSLSSSSPFTAPARAAAMARDRKTFWQMLGDVRL
jgi:hypothetical protein